MSGNGGSRNDQMPNFCSMSLVVELDQFRLNRMTSIALLVEGFQTDAEL